MKLSSLILVLMLSLTGCAGAQYNPGMFKGWDNPNNAWFNSQSSNSGAAENEYRASNVTKPVNCTTSWDIIFKRYNTVCQ